MKDWQEHEAIYKVYTEGKKLEAGKYHGRFDKTAKELRALGASVPSRDAIHFISNLLEYVGIFAEDETDSVVKNNKFAEKRLRFLELLDIHSEEIKSSAADIEENYDSQLKRYFGVESANRGSKGRQDKYSANAADIEMKKQQKEELQKLKSAASGGAADALNVISNSLRNISDEVFGGADSFEVDAANPDTSINIKLKNPGFNSKVVNFLKPFVGDSEIDIDMDKDVWVWASPDSPIAKLVAQIGRDRVEDSIYDWIESNTTGGDVEIVPPLDAKSIQSMIEPRRRVTIDEPEDTDADPEYGSALPDDAPEMGDEERYSPRASSRPSFMGDDEDYGGDSDYTPYWAQEAEEHEGARRSPEEGEYDLDYDKDAYNDESDLDDDGELSEYEKSAIKKAMKKGGTGENNEDIKMSPQQMNQWMYNQRNSRMQNNLRQNERWGNY